MPSSKEKILKNLQPSQIEIFSFGKNGSNMVYAYFNERFGLPRVHVGVNSIPNLQFLNLLHYQYILWTRLYIRCQVSSQFIQRGNYSFAADSSMRPSRGKIPSKTSLSFPPTQSVSWHPNSTIRDPRGPPQGPKPTKNAPNLTRFSLGHAQSG